MLRTIAVVAIALVALGPTASAHDVPNDVTVQAFLRPEGQHLRFVVRVPLDAMRDVDIPKRGSGYVDLARVDAALRHAATIWIVQNIELYEEDARLASPSLTAVRVSLPSDPSFREYTRALAHVTGPPLDPATELYWEQGMLDAVIDYPIASTASRFAIRSDLRRLGIRVAVALRFITTQGIERAFALHDDPALVRLDPRWHQAALNFTRSGFFHVLDGADHLLFLLCVVLPLRRLRPLVVIVTSFTIAHSITLVWSAYGAAPGALWFVPLVETLIALSIVYMALENIVGQWGRGGRVGRQGAAGEGGSTAYLDRRWIVTGLFGLVHGLGFSFALRDNLQFAGSHVLTSLLAFNVGVELAQLVVIGVSCAALAAVFRYVVPEQMGTIILSAIVAHTGWHWMTERGALLGQYSWPAVDAAFLASAIGWLTLAVIVGGVWWAARTVASARAAAPRTPETKGSYATYESSRGGL